jgi:NDP-sugar pyrophosphorylase family protein
MQAVLMAGGKGTRLRPFTMVLPKPLVPLGEMAILEMVLHQLRHYAFKEAIICVGHKAELIMAVVGNGERFGLRVEYHKEASPLGTLGAVAELGDRLDDDFLVMNGDICTDLSFRKIYDDHVENQARATIGTCRREERIELGVLDLDATGRVVGFREKPVQHLHVSMGVNVFHRSILELIPRGTPFGFDDLMHRMIERGVPMHTFVHEGRWLDIGRPDDYDRLVGTFERDRRFYLPGEPDSTG